MKNLFLWFLLILQMPIFSMEKSDSNFLDLPAEVQVLTFEHFIGNAIKNFNSFDDYKKKMRDILSVRLTSEQFKNIIDQAIISLKKRQTSLSDLDIDLKLAMLSLKHYDDFQGNSIKLYLKSCFDVNAQFEGNRWRDDVGKTACMFASELGQEKILKVLIKHKADLNLQHNFTFNAAIHYAHHLNIVKILVKNGADIDCLNRGRCTPLDLSMDRNSEVAKFLIDSGCNLNKRNSIGETALIYASLNGYKEIIEYMLKFNPEIDAQDRHGQTALMCAVIKGHAKIVKLLLEKGANVNLRNGYGKTALQLALELARDKEVGDSDAQSEETVNLLKANSKDSSCAIL